MTSETRTARTSPQSRPVAPEADVNRAAAYGVRIQPANVPAGARYWRVVDVRHLSPDENRGKHHVYVRALDENEMRLRDPNLRIAWSWEGRKADEHADPKPLDKQEGELGHGNVDLFKHQRTEVWLEGDMLPSDRVVNLHTDHEAAELTSDGQDGNTRFHHSFLITFQRTRKAAEAADAAAAAPASSPAPMATATPANGAAAPSAVDMAAFVREEDDAPDGVTLPPGARFTKCWVLRNTGTTTWTPDYKLTWIGGDSLDAPAAVPVPATPPGAEAQLTVDFVVPSGAGRRRSIWQLSSGSGARFGDTVWADIQIASPSVMDGEAALAAPDGKQLLLPVGAGPVAQALTQAWNRYGGLVLAESDRLGIDPAAAMAVLVAESRGEPFAAGRMTIRFENHLFYQYWGKNHEALFRQHFAFHPDKVWTGHTWRPDPAQAMQPCHTGNRQEWEVLDFARRLDDTAALKSVSMGAAQIMGFNHAAVGYATPQAMLQAFEHDAGAQLRALFRFMEVNELVDAVRGQDYREFARVYNGPGQADTYATLMRDYAAAFRSLMQTAGSRALEPQAPTPGERPRTPIPTSPKPGVPLSEADPELYAAWRQHIANGFQANDVMFQRVLDGFMNPYWATVWMYRILFGVGVAAFVVAAVVALLQNNPVTTLIFGGLSVAAFLGYFVSRPLQALEENLQFITWLGIIYNTYWSQLVQAQDPATYAQELDKATDLAIRRIRALMDKHAERSGARPSLQADDRPPA